MVLKSAVNDCVVIILIDMRLLDVSMPMCFAIHSKTNKAAFFLLLINASWL